MEDALQMKISAITLSDYSILQEYLNLLLYTNNIEPSEGLLMTLNRGA